MGEWEHKPLPFKGKRARRAAASDAPKRKFANIDGKRVEVRQAPAKEARPYPSAPVTARPGSRVAASTLRGTTDPGIPKLPFRRIGAELEVGRKLTKPQQANHLPFVPEFQAEGQPFPRMARDKDGNVMPRVRTDNGMTDKLKGRGIGNRQGETTWTKRQLKEHAEYGYGKRRAATREEYQHANKGSHLVMRDKINDALARERAAIASGDMDRAEFYRAQVRELRKAARTKA
ncbi:hypothetical protein [Streptomyces ardesiacus]|uniref:hypothetical protein n=1 Tax=Streptomyces ardesiacus TaxID=285564 RepID=UPI00382F589E